MALALEGIRILDLSAMPPASTATMYLADLGAEVLKIELPIKEMPLGALSDPSPPVQDEPGVRIAAYNALNRNKKSVGLNLKSPQGNEIFLKLAKDADVIFESFRPGVVSRLGIDYEVVKKINPRIIYCSLSGYGQDGPYAQMPGHDINYAAIGGALNLIGEIDGPPVIPLNIVGDSAGGTLHAVIGILVALMGRQQTGQGQYVDVSMTDGVISMLGLLSVWHFMSGMIPQRGTIYGAATAYPQYTVYKTKDGSYLAIGCLEPHFWANLCKELGKEEFIPAPMELGENSEQMRAGMQQILLTKTSDEWFTRLASKNIPISKVPAINEVFADPQVLARKMLLELDHPTLGKVNQVGIPIKFSETPGEVRSFAPFLGQHTDEMLGELGYSNEERQQLREQGIIG